MNTRIIAVLLASAVAGSAAAQIVSPRAQLLEAADAQQVPAVPSPAGQPAALPMAALAAQPVPVENPRRALNGQVFTLAPGYRLAFRVKSRYPMIEGFNMTPAGVLRTEVRVVEKKYRMVTKRRGGRGGGTRRVKELQYQVIEYAFYWTAGTAQGPAAVSVTATGAKFVPFGLFGREANGTFSFVVRTP